MLTRRAREIGRSGGAATRRQALDVFWSKEPAEGKTGGAASVRGTETEVFWTPAAPSV